MSQDPEDRLTALKRYTATLNQAERRRQLDKTRDAETITSAVRNGDALAIQCALDEGRNLEQPDRDGMTPLHHAAAHDTSLIATALIESAGGAQWIRDAYGRLPLDVAREAGHVEIGDRLERITYPGLYRDERAGPVRTGVIERQDERRRELGSPNTRPADTRDFPARGILAERPGRHRDGQER